MVFEILGGRTPDQTIWEYAVKEQAIMITCNRDDFLALTGTAPGTGLVILNRKRTRAQECAGLLRLLESDGPEGLPGNINFA